MPLHKLERAQQRRASLKSLSERAAQLLADDDDVILTFREWVALNGFSARTGRRILDAPGGPIVTRLSPRRIGITRANNRRWLESRSR